MKWWLNQARLVWPATVLMVAATVCVSLAGAGTGITVGVVFAASMGGFCVTECRRGRQ